MSAADFAMVEVAFDRMRQTVARLHAAGVPLHTGSDCNAPNIVPGASLHRELEPARRGRADARAGAGALDADVAGVLDARLARYRAHYEGFAFSKLVMPVLRLGLRALSGRLGE